MKNIYNNIYRLSIPLTNNPLKEIHTYIVKGKQYSLLIDTGFNNAETKKHLYKALDNLQIPISNLKVFITHLHADHAGLATHFYHQGCEVFASQKDSIIMNQIIDGSFASIVTKNITLLDLDRYHIDRKNLPQTDPENKDPITFTVLKEGDTLTIDNTIFKIINVSGHTPGMLALYDIKHETLFGADHILDQISPNIAYWGENFPALATFLLNLQNIIPLNIKTIYPSHRNEMYDHPRRALELIKHHHERLDEILSILNKETNPISASQVAAKMQWNFRAPSWNEFPNAQKFFAAHEAMAHLEYLCQKSKIHKNITNNIAYFKSF